MNVILHIAGRAQWLRGRAEGAYRADSLATQGFIHASRPHQLLGVANILFRGQRDLVLLYIDPNAVSAEIKYEAPPGSQEAFPHVYGPLNTDAVIKVVDFLPDDDGLFALPADVALLPSRRSLTPRSRGAHPPAVASSQATACTTSRR